MPRTLPGMPLAAGDMFICTGIGEDRPPVQPHALTIMRSPVASVRPLHGHWLILALCRRCIEPRGLYCSNHNARNWWLVTRATTRRS